MGYIDVEEMLHKIPAWKLSRWVAFLNIDPQGEQRADLRAGIIASTIANVNRGKNTKPFVAKDFMPDFSDVRPKGQTVAQMKVVLQAINAASRDIKLTPAEAYKMEQRRIKTEELKRQRREQRKLKREGL